MDHEGRLLRFKDECARLKVSSFLVTNEKNVRYLSGFTGHDSMLLVTEDANYFLTDSRYYEEALNQVKCFKVKLVEGSIFETIEEILTSTGSKEVGFEASDLSYEIATRLKEALDKVTAVPLKGVVERLRSVKEPSEIEAIKISVRLTRKILDKTFKAIIPGVSEISLCKKIEVGFIQKGSEVGFAPIVAFGKNASKPHASATDAVFESGSFAMVDIGCSINGYHADMTRMFIAGCADTKLKAIYEIVREAQERAINRVKPGERIADIDKSARDFIDGEGYGTNFGHAVGHSIGLEVHESPSISSHSDGMLKPGMVFTVEPGIYLPGFGGVRIEDMVAVTETGCEVLTR